jgi:hypothetical protein
MAEGAPLALYRDPHALPLGATPGLTLPNAADTLLLQGLRMSNRNALHFGRPTTPVVSARGALLIRLRGFRGR